MKPSERIAHIAEEKCCRCASDHDLQRGIARVYDRADGRAIAEYLDELHTELETLRKRVRELEMKRHDNY